MRIISAMSFWWTLDNLLLEQVDYVVNFGREEATYVNSLNCETINKDDDGMAIIIISLR